MSGENAWGTNALTIVAAFLAIPLVMMGVVMPLVVVTGMGPMAGAGGGGGLVMLLPAIPFTLLVVLAYIVGSRLGAGRDDDGETDGGGHRAASHDDDTRPDGAQHRADGAGQQANGHEVVQDA
jgi:hypothetical protein